jgi:leucyl aminopeptidase
MSILLKKITDTQEVSSSLFLTPSAALLKDFGFTGPETGYIERNINNKTKISFINRYQYLNIVRITDEETDTHQITEKYRNDGATISKKMADEKQQVLTIYDLASKPLQTLALIEGILFSSYQFIKYKTKKEELPTVITEIRVVSPTITQKELDELTILMDAVAFTRDLINDSPASITALTLADSATEQAHALGINIKVFHKEQLEAMNFGGLLTVNKGSVIPPTFTVMEWKPENCANTNPYVIIGKGISYDTGGINLKTMAGSLDDMKCDMSGAAAVIGTMMAVAANKIPVHLIALIPATDNRPGFNAYVPGDVILMHNGITVEVMNTDAEGRLILADALSYAQTLNPELVIDLATLTGNAMMAIGSYGMVAMGTAPDEIKNQLTLFADTTGERIAWFPFWDEYDDLIKSEVADIKNTGGREAGAITAGKFLARFTNYPWIHLDIAGPAFLSKPWGYRSTGATGVGVRLLYRYFQSICS